MIVAVDLLHLQVEVRVREMIDQEGGEIESKKVSLSSSSIRFELLTQNHSPDLKKVSSPVFEVIVRRVGFLLNDYCYGLWPRFHFRLPSRHILLHNLYSTKFLSVGTSFYEKS